MSLVHCVIHCNTRLSRRLSADAQHNIHADTHCWRHQSHPALIIVIIIIIIIIIIIMVIMRQAGPVATAACATGCPRRDQVVCRTTLEVVDSTTSRRHTVERRRASDARRNVVRQHADRGHKTLLTAG